MWLGGEFEVIYVVFRVCIGVLVGVYDLLVYGVVGVVFVVDVVNKVILIYDMC